MRLHSYRAVFAGAVQVAVTGQYGFGAVYNNSSQANILRIRKLQVWAATPQFLYVQRVVGTVGTLVGSGVNVFESGPVRAGALYTGTTSTNPNTQNILYTISTLTTYAPQQDTVFYLYPGKSLTITLGTNNTQCAFSFVWEDLTIDMLDPWEIGKEDESH